MASKTSNLDNARWLGLHLAAGTSDEFLTEAQYIHTSVTYGSATDYNLDTLLSTLTSDYSLFVSDTFAQAFTATSYSTSAHTIYFYNVDGDIVGTLDTTNFWINSTVKSVTVTSTDGDGNEGTFLYIVFNVTDDDGNSTTQGVYVDAADMLPVYTGQNGIYVGDDYIEAVKSANSEDYLFIDDTGIGVSGIDDALAAITSKTDYMYTVYRDDILFALVDANKYMLWNVDTTGAFNVLDKISSYTSGYNIYSKTTDNWLFALIDKNENLLLGAEPDGTLAFTDKLSSSTNYHIYTKESKQWLYTLLDRNGKVAFGVRTDGSVYPLDEVKQSLSETIKKLTKTTKSLKNSQTDVSQLQEDLDAVEAKTEYIRIQEDSNYLFALVDPNNNLLAGCTLDGKWVIPKGIPDEVSNIFNVLCALLYPKTTDGDYLAALVDKNNNVLLKVLKDGTIEFNNTLSAYSGYKITAVTLPDTQDSIFQLTDANDNIVATIDSTGTVTFAGGVNANGDLTVNNGRYKGVISVKNATEYIFAILDANNKLAFGIKKDGSSYLSEGRRFTKDIKSYLYVIIDNMENVLFGIWANGTIYAPTLYADKAVIGEASIANYDKELKVIKNTTKHLSVIKNENYLFALVDANKEVLAAVLTDGTCWIPKGIPDDSNALFEILCSLIYKRKTDGTYLAALIDKNENVIVKILNDGTIQFANMLSAYSGYKIYAEEQTENADSIFQIKDVNGKIIATISKAGVITTVAGLNINGDFTINNGSATATFSNKTTTGYLFAVVDANDKVIFGVGTDGTFYVNAISVMNSDSSTTTVTSEYFSTAKSKTYLFVLADSSSSVLAGVWLDGTVYMPSLYVESATIDDLSGAAVEKINKQISDLEATLSDFQGGCGDWSDAESLDIAEPRLAIVNISGVSKMPTSKGSDYHAYMEVWDLNGNYFKKKIILDAQGNSSLAFEKDNFAVDICNDDWEGDDTFVLRIGNWVPQDSFHFKAYYIDPFRGCATCNYALFKEMSDTRGVYENVPWKKELLDTDSITYKLPSFGNTLVDEFELQYDTGARCHPLGFPALVYLNDEFYGIFAWQLKKHRDNMHQTKDVAEHIHLDGTLGTSTIMGVDTDAISWTSFEIRNPKNLYTIDGEEYDGDNPTEIAGEDEVNEWIDAGELPDGTTVSKKIQTRLQTTASVKTYIQNFSQYMVTLKSLYSTYTSSEDEDDLTTLKETFETYFDVDNIIDYETFTDVIRNSDSHNKNWQWFTYDGVKWYVAPYDLDQSWGYNYRGGRIDAPTTSHLSTSTSLPAGYIYRYYIDEWKARYAELADAGIIDADHIFSYIKDWYERVGEINYEKEWKKWSNCTCIGESVVNTTYWEIVTDDDGNYVTGSSSTYDETVTYAEGDTCYYGYNSMMGYYQFTCIAECTAVAPIKTFRFNDSLYRLKRYIEQQISNMDSLYGYTRS